MFVVKIGCGLVWVRQGCSVAGKRSPFSPVVAQMAVMLDLMQPFCTARRPVNLHPLSRELAMSLMVTDKLCADGAGTGSRDGECMRMGSCGHNRVTIDASGTSGATPAGSAVARACRWFAQS